jgi:ABC-type lipoprotein export system ATPase subunit
VVGAKLMRAHAALSCVAHDPQLADHAERINEIHDGRLA